MIITRRKYVRRKLTRDVELTYTPTNNTALAKIGIAVSEYAGKGKNDEVSFYDVTVWGKKAELCNQYLSKGRQIVVDGRLHQERFQDKQGNNRSKVTIIADSVQFVGGSQNNNSSNNSNPSNNSSNDFDNIDFSISESDNIPF